MAGRSSTVSATLHAHEPLIRLGAFAGILAAMMVWEWLSPRRNQEIGRTRRWPGSLGIVALDTVVVRLVFPAAAVGTALLAEARGCGLFRALEAPAWLAFAASVILLDLASTSSTYCSTPCRCCGGCTGCTTPILSST